jgi:hypothetical protein
MLFALVVPLAHPAAASHIAEVALTPDSDTAAAGTCNPFTATLTGSTSGSTVAGQIIDVMVEQTGGADASNNIQFCTPEEDETPADGTDQGGPNARPTSTADSDDPTLGADKQISGETGPTAAYQQDNDPTTADQGVVTFGILVTTGLSDTTELEVTAYVDDNPDNDDPDTDEPSDTSTKGFVPGGANNVDDLDCEPESDINPEGTSHSFQCVATTTAPDPFAPTSPIPVPIAEVTEPVPGVGVTFDVIPPDCTATTGGGTNTSTTCDPGSDNGGVNTDGPESPNADEVTNVACTTTDQTGTSTCSYTDPVTPQSPQGTDQIRAFVNQTGGSPSTPGFDTGEPSDEITKEWTQAPSGLTVTLVCDDGQSDPAQGTTPASTADSCFNPVTQDTESFTATVTGPDTANDADTNPDPQPNVQVQFSISATGPSSTDDDTLITAIAPVNPAANQEGSPNSTTADCTTGGDGRCEITIENPNAESGDFAQVTANIKGQTSSTGQASDTARKTWGYVARAIDCEPETQTVSPGGSAVITCSVTDRLGNPVPNQNATVTEEGPGTFSSPPAGNVYTTDSSGKFEVRVTSATNEEGAETITATLDQATSIDTNGDGINDQKECQRATNEPAQGDRASACSDAVQVVWGTPPPRVQCDDGVDNDADGLTDLQDPGCSSSADDDETDPQQDKRGPTGVTITYRQGSHAFKGTVTNPYRRCRVNRPVVLKRVRPGTDWTVGRDRTDQFGNYKITKRRVGGKSFYVKAKPTSFTNGTGGTTFCSKGRSGTLRMPRR